MTPITASVGLNGFNRKRDVLRVQISLNMVPPELGGPEVKLKMDDISGPKTIAAIRKFQVHHFGLRQDDGRVDPKKRTERKLHELEGTVQTIPMMHLSAGLQEARERAQAALEALNKVAAADGTPLPESSNNRLEVEGLRVAFSLSWLNEQPGNIQRTVTQEDLKKLKSVFQNMSTKLGAPSFFHYIETKFMDMFNEFSKQKFPAVKPLSTAGAIIAVKMKFADFDPVNQFGLGPRTRAAILLQAAAASALNQSNHSFIASQLFIESSLSPTDILAPERYSYYGQWMKAGTRRLDPFFHIPDRGLMTDVPNLP